MGREGKETKEETNCKVCSRVLVSQTGCKRLRKRGARETANSSEQSSRLCGTAWGTTQEPEGRVHRQLWRWASLGGRR